MSKSALLSKQVRYFDNDVVLSMEVHPFVPILAIGFATSRIKLYDLHAKQFIALLSDRGEVGTIAWSPCGNFLASGSSDRAAREYSIQIWKVAITTVRKVFRVHTSLFLLDQLIPPLGSAVALAGARSARLVCHQDVITQVAFRPVVDFHEWQSVSAGPSGLGLELNTKRLNPHLRVRMAMHNLANREAVARDRPKSCSCLVSVSADRTVRVWDFAGVSLDGGLTSDQLGNALLRQLQNDVMDSNIISPLNMMSTKLMSHEVAIAENMRQMQAKQNIEFKAHVVTRKPRPEDLLPDVPMFRSVWRRHGSAVTSCAFSHDGLLLATGGADGTICVWRMHPSVHLYLQVATYRVDPAPIFSLSEVCESEGKRPKAHSVLCIKFARHHYDAHNTRTYMLVCGTSKGIGLLQVLTSSVRNDKRLSIQHILEQLQAQRILRKLHHDTSLHNSALSIASTSQNCPFHVSLGTRKKSDGKNEDAKEELASDDMNGDGGDGDSTNEEAEFVNTLYTRLFSGKGGGVPGGIGWSSSFFGVPSDAQDRSASKLLAAMRSSGLFPFTGPVSHNTPSGKQLPGFSMDCMPRMYLQLADITRVGGHMSHGRYIPADPEAAAQYIVNLLTEIYGAGLPSDAMEGVRKWLNEQRRDPKDMSTLPLEDSPHAPSSHQNRLAYLEINLQCMVPHPFGAVSDLGCFFDVTPSMSKGFAMQSQNGINPLANLDMRTVFPTLGAVHCLERCAAQLAKKKSVTRSEEIGGQDRNGKDGQNGGETGNDSMLPDLSAIPPVAHSLLPGSYESWASIAQEANRPISLSPAAPYTALVVVVVSGTRVCAYTFQQSLASGQHASQCMRCHPYRTPLLPRLDMRGDVVKSSDGSKSSSSWWCCGSGDNEKSDRGNVTMLSPTGQLAKEIMGRASLDSVRAHHSWAHLPASFVYKGALIGMHNDMVLSCSVPTAPVRSLLFRSGTIKSPFSEYVALTGGMDESFKLFRFRMYANERVPLDKIQIPAANTVRPNGSGEGQGALTDIGDSSSSTRWTVQSVAGFRGSHRKWRGTPGGSAAPSYICAPLTSDLAAELVVDPLLTAHQSLELAGYVLNKTKEYHRAVRATAEEDPMDQTESKTEQRQPTASQQDNVPIDFSMLGDAVELKADTGSDQKVDNHGGDAHSRGDALFNAMLISQGFHSQDIHNPTAGLHAASEYANIEEYNSALRVLGEEVENDIGEDGCVVM